MNLLSRISLSLRANVERTLSQVENHEAIIDASLQEARRSATTARLQLDRVRKDGDELRSRLEQNARDVDTWRRRAAAVANDDRDRALACLERAGRVEAALAGQRAQLAEHEQEQARLADRVQHIETRLADLLRKRNALRSREATTRANQQINASGLAETNTLDEQFDRWESAITINEAVSRDTEDALALHRGRPGRGSEPQADPLARQFEASERRSALEAELEAVINTDSVSTDPNIPAATRAASKTQE